MTPVTLCFLRRDDEVLLIEKRRGLGEGLVNGPGGKVEPGETPRAAAAREVEEEVGVSVEPAALEWAAELTFRLDGTVHSECHVFRGRRFEGEPRPSAEARPLWVPVTAIPYDRMWPDDELWLPHVLEGETVRATFEFTGGEPLDEATLVDHDLTVGVTR